MSGAKFILRFSLSEQVAVKGTACFICGRDGAALRRTNELENKKEDEI